jgi:hypothetical protein
MPDDTPATLRQRLQNHLDRLGAAQYKRVALLLLDEILANRGCLADDEKLRRRLRTTRTALARLRELTPPWLLHRRKHWLISGDNSFDSFTSNHPSARTSPAGNNDSVDVLIGDCTRHLGELGLSCDDAARLAAQLLAYHDHREVLRCVRDLHRHRAHLDAPSAAAELMRRVNAGAPPKTPAKARLRKPYGKEIWRMAAPPDPDSPCLLVARDERNSERHRRARAKIAQSRSRQQR